MIQKKIATLAALAVCSTVLLSATAPETTTAETKEDTPRGSMHDIALCAKQQEATVYTRSG